MGQRHTGIRVGSPGVSRSCSRAPTSGMERKPCSSGTTSARRITLRWSRQSARIAFVLTGGEARAACGSSPGRWADAGGPELPRASDKLWIVDFEIIDPIHDIETVAVNTSTRDLDRLKKMYGNGRWRKLKGISRVRLRSGRIRLAELHWYEAHGIGKRDMRRKRYLD